MGLVITRVAAREKKKAPGPCELRALLRDEPSRPCTRHGLKAHHRAPPDLAIRQRQLCSGARPSAQPYVACATRSESLPIASRAGNDRNASPGELDFMHGRMTRRHEGFVSTMLTESGLSIALALRHFKCLVRRNGRCKPTSTAFRVLFVLTSRSRVLEAVPASGPSRVKGCFDRSGFCS